LKPDDGKPDNAWSARNPGHDYIELWITLSRRQWSSLVLIPADRGGSTAEIANGLADIGQRLSYGPVTAIAVRSLEYGSALALADLQEHVDRERRNRERPDSVVDATLAPAEPMADPPDAVNPDDSAGGPPPPGEAPGTQSIVRTPPARVIISVPPVVSEPLGLAAAGQADAVVLAIRMNESCMADVRRTVELVGRERVTGCFLVR
jgi:hypothetical protein